MNYNLEVSSSTVFFTSEDKVINELLSYSKLKAGWDFGSGVQLSSLVIHKAVYTYNALRNPILNYECSPLSDGRVQITFFIKDHFLDVFVGVDEYNIVYEKGIGVNYETILEVKSNTLSKAEKLLDEIITECYSFVQSTSLNIIPERKDLKTVFPTWREESPYFLGNVQLKSQPQYATI